jgi:hypothetical protein
LETLIAAGLTVVILSTLTYFYQQIDYMNNKSEALQRENFKLLNMENRLSQIFPLVVGEKDKSKDFIFFTLSDPGGIFKSGSSKSLVFAYDNRVDVIKVLSNHVLGELFLDPQGRLSLATWPIPARWPESGMPPIKKEILLTDVDGFAMWFFVPPEKKGMPSVDTNTKQTATTHLKPSPEGAWIEEWSQEYKILPGIIRLEIKRKGETEYYVFPLSQAGRQPVYNQ